MNFASVEALFHRAMELPQGERTAMVNSCTSEDLALRREVLSLIDAVAAADRLHAGPHELRPAPADLSWTGRRLGAFQLGSLLGKGGMGHVYVGHRVDGDFQQVVAVKIIAAQLNSPTLRTMFLHERDALARLKHPHIAQLLDGGVTEDGAPFLVMEIVGDEQSHAERIDEFCEHRQLPTRARVELLIALCEAVAYAHRKLVVHGDLKPGNVLMTPEGVCKLLDFGAARWLAGHGDSSSPVSFTPAYASPEQMRGESLTVRSDIFSMGRLIERVLGKLSFPELRAILTRATRTEPELRYASMEEFAGELRAWMEHRPVRAYGDSRGYKSRKWAERQRVPLAVGILVLGVQAACLAQMHRATQEASSERDRALHSADAVEALAHRLLFDFQAQLEDLGASTGAQHQLATITLRYLDDLSRDPEIASRKLRLDVATAYTRMGDLLGNPYSENLGRPKEAETALNKAVGSASALVHDLPGDIQAQFSLAMARRSLAEVLFGEGDKADSLKEMKESVETFQKLAQRADATPPQLIEAAATLGSLGDVYGLRGNNSLERTTDAIDCYKQQIGLFQRVLQTDPSSVRSRRGIAIGEFKIANLHTDTDPKAAIEGYRRALQNLDLLPESSQQAAPTVRVRSGVVGHMGDAYFALGQFTEAIVWMKRARDHAAGLVATDPLDSRARFDLHLNEMRLADTYARIGNTRLAREHYTAVLQVLAFLRKRDPNNPILQDHQHEVEGKLAKLH